VTSNPATQLSHFLSQAAIDKLPHSDYRLHPLETIGSRKPQYYWAFAAISLRPLTSILPSPHAPCIGSSKFKTLYSFLTLCNYPFFTMFKDKILLWRPLSLYKWW